MKILIFGANGMLGQNVVCELKNENLITPTSQDCNITNRHAIENLFHKIQYADIVINCAAFTNVDKCEEESNKAFSVNATAIQFIAKSCEKFQLPLIHVSTDYVFDGEKEWYTVDDIPKKQNTIYGRSKFLAEEYIKQIMSRYYIVRTAWLYGKNGKNFVTTISNLAKNEQSLKIVNDQFGCPTYTKDLSKAIKSLIGSEKYGIHHAVGEGSCSWYEFAKEITKKEIIPISTQKSFDLFPHIKAKRPKSSRLRNTLYMRPWQTALKEFLHENNLD